MQKPSAGNLEMLQMARMVRDDTLKTQHHGWSGGYITHNSCVGLTGLWELNRRQMGGRRKSW